MLCELVAYMVRSLILNEFIAKDVKSVEFVFDDCDFILKDEIDNLRNAIKVDGLKIGFNREFGLILEYGWVDERTNNLEYTHCRIFDNSDVKRIYLETKDKTVGLFPYMTKDGIVWELLEN